MGLLNSARSRLVLGSLVAALVALVFVGCGGGDDPEGERISVVIADVLTVEDAERKCNDLLSEAFVDAVYGSLENCIAAGQPDSGDGEPPTEVRVSEIEINGDTATAVVVEVGGETDGASGTFTLVEVEDQWRVDEMGVDYLRSQLERGLAGYVDSADADQDNPLMDPVVRECLGENLAALDDEQFRQIAYDGMADREPSEVFVNAFLACMPELAADGNG